MASACICSASASIYRITSLLQCALTHTDFFPSFSLLLAGHSAFGIQDSAALKVDADSLLTARVKNIANKGVRSTPSTPNTRIRSANRKSREPAATLPLLFHSDVGISTAALRNLMRCIPNHWIYTIHSLLQFTHRRNIKSYFCIIN